MENKLPIRLKIISTLFLIDGLLAVTGIIWGLLHLNVDSNVGFLAIPIAFRLRALDESGRKFAIYYSILASLIGGIALVNIILTSGTFTDVMLPYEVQFRTSYLAFANEVATHCSFPLSLWIIHVLTRPSIRCLFTPCEPIAQEDNAAQCPQCGVNFKSGRNNCHRCGWKPPVEESAPPLSPG